MTCHRDNHCDGYPAVMPFPPDCPELAALDLLRSVVALGSLSRAAEAHGITQPSASSRIRTLERQLGVTVLDRSPTGSRPDTRRPTRRRLGEHRVGCRDNVDTGVEALRARQAGLLRIAASYTIAEYLLPPWLDRFLADRPDDSVTLEVTNSRAVLERLESGSVDLGFIESPNAPSTMHQQVVGTDELIAVVSPRHPWAARGSVDLATFVATPLVVRERVGYPRCTAGRAGPARVRSAGVSARPRVVVGGADRGDQRIGPDGHQSARRRRRPGRRLIGRDRRRGDSRSNDASLRCGRHGPNPPVWWSSCSITSRRPATGTPPS